MADGLLWVTSEPGAGQDDAFHDWYDTEHVPARTAFDAIATADRLRAVDGTVPGWLAAYDLDLAVLADPAYRRLRDERSPREREVVAGLQVFDRRVYAALTDDGDADARAPVWVAVALSVPPDAEAELAAWYAEEHVPGLLAIPGWRRTRRFALREGDGPAFLAVHELDDESPLGTDAYRAVTGTPRRAALMARVTARERRVWRLHRRFK